ncbi:MAG TPA: hypothetical protein VJZ91_10050 [Blastocatellia bacterium]|nr:hypothetical protein [Blastocatellia bacterium]
MRRRLIDNWPKIAFVYLPLVLALVVATLLVRERLQPDAAKAIRLVRESNSRKENFTVQQYLYSTVFYRQRQGEAIEIDGWRADSSEDAASPFLVRFSYSDGGGHHVATWQADVRAGRTTPLDDAARELSWH